MSEWDLGSAPFRSRSHLSLRRGCYCSYNYKHLWARSRYFPENDLISLRTCHRPRSLPNAAVAIGEDGTCTFFGLPSSCLPANVALDITTEVWC